MIGNDWMLWLAVLFLLGSLISFGRYITLFRSWKPRRSKAARRLAVSKWKSQSYNRGVYRESRIKVVPTPSLTIRSPRNGSLKPGGRTR